MRTSHPVLDEELGQAPMNAPHTDALVWSGTAPHDDVTARAMRERIARFASAHVGDAAVVVDGERFRMDCSGVVRGIYAHAGIRLGRVPLSGRTNDTRALFEWIKPSGSLRRSNPLPGDLAFFDDTWDQNGNGLRDDPLSHVAIVERVHDDTVVLVHRVGERIVRAFMTLSAPHTRHDAKGRPLNHFLRSGASGEPAKTTAELFVAFGSVPLPPGQHVASR